MGSRLCKNCQQEFDSKRKEQSFCSRKCVGQFVGRLSTKPWNKGKSIPKQMKEKISQTLKGRKMPYVAKANMKRKGVARPQHSEVMRSLWMNDSFRKNFSKKMSGENHPNWIKDRTKIKISDRFKEDANYKIWRKRVYERDNWVCRIANLDCSGKIEAHHILPWCDFPELRYEVNNGITLCHAHHPLRRAEVKRLAPYFMELVAETKDDFGSIISR